MASRSRSLRCYLWRLLLFAAARYEGFGTPDHHDLQGQALSGTQLLSVLQRLVKHLRQRGPTPCSSPW